MFAAATESCGGGVLLVWDNDRFSARDRIQSSRWIIVVGNLKPFEWEYAVGVIYGEHSIDYQSVVYEEINQALESINVPFLLTGDFNQILHVEDRKGQLKETGGMRIFSDWINTKGLIDLPL